MIDLTLYHLFLGFASLFGVVMTFVLFILYRTYPSSIQGLREWCIGSAAWSMASFMYILRGELPLVFSIILANTLVVAGPSYYYIGILKFIDKYKSSDGWLMFALTLFVTSCLFLFLYIYPAYRIRGSILILSVIIIDLLILKLVLKYLPNTLGKYFVMAVVSVMTVGWLIRGIKIISGDIPENFQASTNANVALFAITPILIPMITLACVLLASEKLRNLLEIKNRFDTLTKALSREAIIEEIGKEVTRSARNGAVFSLLVLDLDEFKKINDTFGHQHGDRVLVSFSETMTSLLRQIDFFGRMGGDEFIILLPETNRQEAEAVVKRIYNENNKNSDYKWSVSVGVASWQGPQDSTDSLIARADQSLYEIKRAKA